MFRNGWTGWGAVLLALCLLLACTCPPALAEEETADPLEESFRKILKGHRTSGASLVIAKDGEIVFHLDYGFAHKRSQTKINADTYFRLASVTKMVTAIRIMQLVEEGKLALDADLSDALGYRIRNPYFPKVPVTLRMLMTHTSSLSPKGGFTNSRNGLRSLISADEIKKGNWYKETPGSVYRYSNFGAGIMGSLMETVTGENLDDCVRRGVFEPMGISAAYSATLLPDPDNVPDLYTGSGGIYIARTRSLTKEWDPGVDPDFHFRITVGSLWMRSDDLCRLGMLLCDGGTLDGVTLLRPETVAAMMEEQNGIGGITAKTPYGLCVQHESSLVDGKMFYGHQGLSEGILSNLYYDPETRFVFAFCSNGCSNGLDHRVARITRRLFTLAWDTFGSPAGASR